MTEVLNPYIEAITVRVQEMLEADFSSGLAGQSASNVVGLDSDNDWKYPHLASRLAMLAYACHRSPDMLMRTASASDLLHSLFGALTDAASDDRWYHGEIGKGDRNIDAFTLIPFVESFLFSKEYLAPELAAAVHRKILGALRVWRTEYAVAKPEFTACPNMDIRHALLMVYGWRLTRHEDYEREFSRYIDLVGQAQFADGAWTYFKGTNECPAYHDSNVAHLARIYDLSHDPRCLDMLRKSIPYYPGVCAPNGCMDYWTDPWWKHLWCPASPTGPDIVAGITGDPANRHVGSRLRALYGVQGGGLNAIYAAMFWREVPISPTPDSPAVIHDKNILGLRGHFHAWSWAATARYGSDTVVGALSHCSADRNPAALLGVTAEISRSPDGPRSDWHAMGMLPLAAHARAGIASESCRFEVAYPLACYRSIFGEVPPFPLAWECRQEWRMNATSLRGVLRLTATADQESPPPRIRIRLGKHLTLTRKQVNAYECPPFSLSISGNDFTEHKISPATACFFEKLNDSTQLTLTVNRPSLARYRQGDSFVSEIEIWHRS